MLLDLYTVRAARECYVTGDLSLREIALQFALNWHTLRTRASTEHWKDSRMDYRLKLEYPTHSAMPVRRRIGQACYLCRQIVSHGSYGEDGLGVYHLRCRLRQDDTTRRTPIQFGEPITQRIERIAERLQSSLSIT